MRSTLGLARSYGALGRSGVRTVSATVARLGVHRIGDDFTLRALDPYTNHVRWNHTYPLCGAPARIQMADRPDAPGRRSH